MAEAVLFSLASNLVKTLLTPAFKAAYERAGAVWGARSALDELILPIRNIQDILLDAERKQEGTARVKVFMDKIKDVLYKAEDLFDEVATHDLLKQQKKGKKCLKKVQLFFSKLNPVPHNNSIALQFEVIKKNLDQISVAMRQLDFEKSTIVEPISGMSRREIGSFVNPTGIFGRDDEKKDILKFLYADKYAEENVSLIAITGIGGMGKSALCQLVYDDENLKTIFKGRMWWVCISDIFDEKEIIGKLFLSITENTSKGLSVDQLQLGIREYLSMNQKFLLVLDDLWDDRGVIVRKWLSLLTSSAKTKGCKIIITTRSSSVADAMRVHKTHKLKDLPEDASWDLFKMIAFNTDQENDPTWIKHGKMVIEKCPKVPLAIKSIADLLESKDTIEEWIYFIENDLPGITLSENLDDSIMTAMKLSYYYLPSHLKHCFSYCSLFQKDSILDKKTLIYLWIAQGYVRPTDDNLQAAGDAYFKDLCRRSFFEGVGDGEIVSCKMHDLIHDLAQSTAGTESLVLMGQSTQLMEGSSQFDFRKIRHASIGCKIDQSWNIPLPLLQAERIRSMLFRFLSDKYQSLRPCMH